MSVEPVPDSSGSVTPDPIVAGDVVRDAAVQRRIDGGRAALGRTVEELAARLDWKARLRRQLTRATHDVGATAQRVFDRAGLAAGEGARRAVGTARRAWGKLRRGQG